MERLIPILSMLRLILLGTVCLFTAGCSRPDGTAFDGVLSSNKIDRIEIASDEKDYTNILTAEGATRMLTRLAATNPMANPVRGKSYVSGRITLMAAGQRVGNLAYFPREQVLSYQKYEFSLKDTNDLSALFR
jgi:hypothetical protein